MMKHLLCVWIFFVCGMMFQLYVHLSHSVWYLLSGITIVLYLLWPRRCPTTRIVLLCLLCCVLGGGVAYYRMQRLAMHFCDDVPPQYAGTIITYGTHYGNGTRFSFLGDDTCAYQVVLMSHRDLHIGDRVVLTGIKKKEPDVGSSGFVQYIYKNSGTLFVRSITQDSVRKIRYSLLESIREYVFQSASGFSAHTRGLYLGMMLGEKAALSFEMKQTFVLSGLIHIVVLSGQNLSYMGMIFWKVARRVGFSFGISIGAVATALYVCVGGGEPPSLRAGCMVLLLFFAYCLKKYPHGPRVFWFSVCILLTFSPPLIFNMSFLLSCLAMIGILYISPLVEFWMLQKNWPPAGVKYFAPIVSVQMFLLPFIVFVSGTFTPYALLANGLVLFAIPFISVAALFHLCFFIFLSQYVTTITGVTIEWVLSYILFIAKTTSSLPYASVPFSLHESIVWIWYIVCAYQCVMVWIKKRITPLTLFTLYEQRKQETLGIVPWFPDELSSCAVCTITSSGIIVQSKSQYEAPRDSADIIWT